MVVVPVVVAGARRRGEARGVATAKEGGGWEGAGVVESWGRGGKRSRGWANDTAKQPAAAGGSQKQDRSTHPAFRETRVACERGGRSRGVG